jgi:hypothetical protein
MSHFEIHNQSSRRGKTVVLSLGFLEDHIVLHLNITPVLCQLQKLSYDTVYLFFVFIKREIFFNFVVFLSKN